MALLEKKVVPVVPRGGNISASEDSSPLLYMAGTLQGRLGIESWMMNSEVKSRQLVQADIALKNCKSHH